MTALWAEHNYTNALIKESSPYLQQHAHNPVNWYPWGKEALEKAKREHKLIFLSIGYSTCHWCHVMEEESFSNEAVAALLNRDYVSIKVDREVYPQIDKKYQQLYMKIYNKRGGWPLTVFMSPEAKVFHLATYIPAEEGYGSKGLMQMLPYFAKYYRFEEKHFDKTLQIAEQSSSGLKLKNDTAVISRFLKEANQVFDAENGGFAKRPKFPEASKLAVLLDIYSLNGSKEAFYMAERTLNKMAKGGIYDQIGGGFFRYTTDSAWQIPHFEKMLYTNAELVSVYVKMYRTIKNQRYRSVAEESIAQMEKNFMQKGVYFSASDADSDGEEGGYFIYRYSEIKKDLKHKGWKLRDIEVLLAYMGIEEDGNIDGDFSQPHISVDKVPKKLNEFKSYLRSVRVKRHFPFVDKKINTAWNAMMVKALFTASKMDDKYLSLAQKRLDALLGLMYQNATLYHQTLLGKPPVQKALLEDYAFLIDTLISAYERTYSAQYLQLAETLTGEAIQKFYKQKQWFLSDDDINALADFDDRYYTSALSVMLSDMIRLTSLTANLKYHAIAKESMANLGGALEKNPLMSPSLLNVFLRLKKGDIIIHANKKKLLDVQEKIDDIKYPFVLSKAEEGNEYLACRDTMCFAHDNNISKLIEKINKAVQ